MNSATGNPLTTSDVPENNWATFIYPYTGNSDIDNDTFRQWVVVHLPKGFTAPSNLSFVDPLTGDLFVGLSRVCVHLWCLWCLWSYVPTDERCECPCHGSQYVPGSGPYPNFPQASYKPVGDAVAGPASLQTPPNNMLPIIVLEAASDGTISTTGTIVGQVGCGQLC
jgi:rieske iron-sulfur protein